jgi:hypothetical protein
VNASAALFSRIMTVTGQRQKLVVTVPSRPGGSSSDNIHHLMQIFTVIVVLMGDSVEK